MIRLFLGSLILSWGTLFSSGAQLHSVVPKFAGAPSHGLPAPILEAFSRTRTLSAFQISALNAIVIDAKIDPALLVTESGTPKNPAEIGALLETYVEKNLEAVRTEDGEVSPSNPIPSQDQFFRIAAIRELGPPVLPKTVLHRVEEAYATYKRAVFDRPGGGNDTDRDDRIPPLVWKLNDNGNWISNARGDDAVSLDSSEFLRAQQILPTTPGFIPGRNAPQLDYLRAYRHPSVCITCQLRNTFFPRNSPSLRIESLDAIKKKVEELNFLIDGWLLENDVPRGRITQHQLRGLVEFLSADAAKSMDALTRNFGDRRLFPERPAIRLTGGTSLRPLKDGESYPTIWVLGWRRGEETPIHDHGASKAVVTVFRGSVEERVFQGKPGEKVKIETRTLKEGAFAPIPSPYIHEFRQPEDGPEWAATIHGYYPPLDEMDFFEVDPNGILVHIGRWEDDELQLERQRRERELSPQKND